MGWPVLFSMIFLYRKTPGASWLDARGDREELLRRAEEVTSVDVRTRSSWSPCSGQRPAGDGEGPACACRQASFNRADSVRAGSSRVRIDLAGRLPGPDRPTPEVEPSARLEPRTGRRPRRNPLALLVILSCTFTGDVVTTVVHRALGHTIAVEIDVFRCAARGRVKRQPPVPR